jgi:hypothetical protein
VGEAFVSSINGLPKNFYSKLFLPGLIIWSIVAVSVSSFDRVQIGIGAPILLYNYFLYHFIRNKTEKTVSNLKSLRDMMSGSLFLVIVIFFRFGVFIFTDFRFQLFVFIVEFFIYLSAIKIIEYYENVALEGVATEDSEKH